MPKGVYQHKSLSEETKKKISEIKKGRKLSEETKQKISEGMRGKPHPWSKGEKNMNWNGGKQEQECKFCGKKFLIK